MKWLRFLSVMKIYNGNPYILINRTKASTIKSNWRKPMPVLVQINGKPIKPWRINMMPIGDGSFYLYLHGDVRKASHTKVGDRVTVKVVFDETYRNGPMHPIPSWFQIALDKHPIAKKNWERLIPSRQKEILRYFSWLKSETARSRNLTRALHVLSGKEARFMARSWNKGK
jgi:hypothetical protein